MKTKEELSALKNEVETLKKKLSELSGEELAQVSGGFADWKEQSADREKQEIGGPDGPVGLRPHVVP